MVVYEGSENYIFISYAHKDAQTVVPILEEMQKNGFRLWYDLGIEAGTEWPEYIAERLEGCHTVIAFMSDHAASSRNCRNEINEALNLEKDMLVIHLSETKLTPGMRLQLNSTQSMFYYHHTSMDSFLTELYKARILRDCRDSSVQEQVPNTNITIEAHAPTPKEEKHAEDPAPAVEEKTTQKQEKQSEDLSAEQLCQLGHTYLRGISVAKDFEEAERWYLMAAKKGSSEAQNALGNFYYKGISVSQDYTKALEWYRKAIETDELPAAYFNVGKCYLLGCGVERDYGAALRCFGKVMLNIGSVICSFCGRVADKLMKKSQKLVNRIKREWG